MGTTIKVGTSAGLSETGNSGAVIGQGTIGGALVSQAVLGEAVEEHFKPGGEGELEYGNVPLAPLRFMDDVIHGVEGLTMAREASNKVDIMVKQRAWALNSSKSVCIIIGSQQQKFKITQELQNKPLMCGQIEIKETQTDKWLGQYLSGKGLSDSVQKTIEARVGKVKGACLEIAGIIQDWRLQVVGLTLPYYSGIPV